MVQMKGHHTMIKMPARTGLLYRSWIFRNKLKINRSHHPLTTNQGTSGHSVSKGYFTVLSRPVNNKHGVIKIKLS